MTERISVDDAINKIYWELVYNDILKSSTEQMYPDHLVKGVPYERITRDDVLELQNYISDDDVIYLHRELVNYASSNKSFRLNIENVGVAGNANRELTVSLTDEDNLRNYLLTKDKLMNFLNSLYDRDCLIHSEPLSMRLGPKFVIADVVVNLTKTGDVSSFTNGFFGDDGVKFSINNTGIRLHYALTPKDVSDKRAINPQRIESIVESNITSLKNKFAGNYRTIPDNAALLSIRTYFERAKRNYKYEAPQLSMHTVMDGVLEKLCSSGFKTTWDEK